MLQTRRFVGGASNMGRWCGIFIRHVRRKTTKLWRKTGKLPKIGAYPLSLVVYCENKAIMLKIFLEKTLNSLTIVLSSENPKHTDLQRACASHVTL